MPAAVFSCKYWSSYLSLVCSQKGQKRLKKRLRDDTIQNIQFFFLSFFRCYLIQNAFIFSLLVCSFPSLFLYFTLNLWISLSLSLSLPLFSFFLYLFIYPFLYLYLSSLFFWCMLFNSLDRYFPTSQCNFLSVFLSFFLPFLFL